MRHQAIYAISHSAHIMGKASLLSFSFKLLKFARYFWLEKSMEKVFYIFLSFVFLQYPVNKFVQLLGFDNRDASVEFLSCYNVHLNNDMDTGEELMHMSKTRLIEPIEEPPSKIHFWIEAKRDGYSIPEVSRWFLRFTSLAKLFYFRIS